MIHKVFIALTSEDIQAAKKIATANDYILTDLSFSIEKGQAIKAAFKDSSDNLLVSKVAEWFKDVKDDNGISFGFVNRFYQSSIRPLATFFSGIDEIILKKGKEKIIFQLPVTLVNKKFTSTYYMAESESIGIHFYNRHDSILPYIEKYLIQNDCVFIGGKRKIAIQTPVLNFFRLWGIYIAMFAKNIFASFAKNAVQKKLSYLTYNKIFLIRSVGQAITIIPYLLLTNEKILIVIGSTFTDKSALNLLSSKLKHKKNIIIKRGANPNFYSVINVYFKAIIKLFARNNYFFNYKGIDINLYQSLGEMIVMNASLYLYISQIKSVLNKVSASFIFSFEQKSPHAFVDAKIAKDLNILSAQIQCVQQSFTDIPNPICADFFLCETPKIKQNFSESFSKDIEKLKYVGSFSGIDTNKARSKKTYNYKLDICLFLGTEYQINVNFLDSFLKISSAKEYNISVKLHPRDAGKYKSAYSNLSFFRSYPNAFREFINNFDLAITFPSGVISDLLHSEIPFLVYAPQHHFYQNAETDFLPFGIETLFDLQSLDAKLRIPFKDFKRNHIEILENFKKDYEIITDFESIQTNLDNLIK